ncbi:hypothetical protein [Nannocystis bainbridge]|uniref:Tetratricopeptide repeat protein n=1 Tax=Nannocystis bainbridge TaxID=2995303 RepID=A0ABT5E4P7_9BACT|nr:hypothetical protein [Nannocystis bainbridge]MDC0720833.1 hypothetical protein [Nannocystis bainbridge]
MPFLEARPRGRPDPLWRAALAGLLAALLALPTASAAPAAAPDPAAVDAGFRSGQDAFDRRDYPAAARTWTRTADLLPETAEHRDNRAGIYEYIVDAYQRALAQDPSPPLLEEALAVLDAYADAHAAAHPGLELPAPVAEARRSLRARLAELQPAPAPVEPERPAPAPPVRPDPPKPWKGLVIGGGVALGAGVAMLAMFGAGLTRLRAHEDDFESPSRTCDTGALVGECAEIHARGKSADALATAGLYAAPVLLGAGVALLVVGLRRRSAAQRFAPTLGRSSIGATWTLQF